jgi:hypothetical protein
MPGRLTAFVMAGDPVEMRLEEYQYAGLELGCC